MTYLQFLLLFVVAPTLLLSVLGWNRARRGVECGRFWTWHWTGTGCLALIAFIWTTPWDNYIVAQGVWTYGADRVLHVIGFVPVEEYAFFVLMPLFNGALFILLLQWRGIDQIPVGRSDAKARVAAALLGVALLVVGLLLFPFERFFYLASTLLWFTPALMIQVMFDPVTLWRNRRLVLMTSLTPAVYLSIVDALAIRQGIWSITERTRTGFELFGLPIEEAVFFFIVSLLLSQGLVLWHRLRRR